MYDGFFLLDFLALVRHPDLYVRIYTWARLIITRI